MISDSGRRLANEMFKNTRGRSAASTMNPQAQINAMTQGAPGGGAAGAPSVAQPLQIPAVFKPQAKPMGAMGGMNLNNSMRKFGGI